MTQETSEEPTRIEGEKSSRFVLRMEEELRRALAGELPDGEAKALIDAAALTQFVDSHRAITKSQLYQDLWVLYELNNLRDGYFVEFGACDGDYLSNTALLESVFGWTGILAEPNPIYHEALSSKRHCRIDRRCVTGRTGDKLAFRCTDEPEFSSLSKYVLNDSHSARRALGRFREVLVDTVSLNDLLEQCEAPKRINYLSIDTEGGELEILEALDHERFKFDLITVEHNFTEDRNKIWKLLIRQGYRRKFESFSRWDDWYVLPRS